MVTSVRVAIRNNLTHVMKYVAMERTWGLGAVTMETTPVEMAAAPFAPLNKDIHAMAVPLQVPMSALRHVVLVCRWATIHAMITTQSVETVAIITAMWNSVGLAVLAVWPSSTFVKKSVETEGELT